MDNKFASSYEANWKPMVYIGGVAQLVRTSVYDRRTFLAVRHDVQLTGDLFWGMSAKMANSAMHPLMVDK